MITDTKLINEKIKANAPMSEREIIQAEVNEWLASEKLRRMHKGYQYYAAKNDILFTPRQIIGEDGQLVKASNIADNRIAHAFLHELCDQKVSYLLGKPLSINSDDKRYTEQVDEMLETLQFQDTLRSAVKDSIIAGIGWLHFYIDANQKFCVKRMNPTEIIPLWKDEEHTELDRIIRVYRVVAYHAKQRVMQTWVSCWSETSVSHFILDQGILIENADVGLPTANVTVDGEPYMWEHIPFVAIKYNEEEQPLLDMIKTLVDEYDRVVSNDSNSLQDQPNSIMVLRNYDGQDLGGFRHNLAAYRAVKVSDEGGVDTLETPVRVDASNQHLERLRRDIYAFGHGVDMHNDVIGKAVSGIALRQAYSTLDMDVNNMEIGLGKSLKQAVWFINQFIDVPEDKVPEWIFNRDIINVEAEAIEMCVKSKGIISEQTLVANHPWVKDVEKELAQLDEEKEKSMNEMGGDYPFGNKGQEKSDVEKDKKTEKTPVKGKDE